MINEDGTLTYTNKVPFFLSWSFGNETLNTVVVALLTSILAVQGTAIFFDLVLGFKKRSTLKIYNLHTYLLSTEFSLPAAIDATFRNDWITERRLRGDIPKGTTIDRESRKISAVVYIGLLFLVLLGPAVNTIVIYLSLEAERTYTFNGAGFGALTFGFNNSFQVWLQNGTGGCFSAVVSFKKTDLPLTTFHVCNSSAEDLDPTAHACFSCIGVSNGFNSSFGGSENPREAELTVFVRNNGLVGLGVRDGSDVTERTFRGEIRRLGETYWAKAEVSHKDLGYLLDIGSSKLEEICDFTT